MGDVDFVSVSTSFVGAPLGAGGAGAGGAAAARPLQGRLHGNVSPPQVGVATATQTQHHLIHTRKKKRTKHGSMTELRVCV